MKTLRSGRLYLVSGASSQTGEDVDVTVEAYDEADAARAANRQGVFVSRCVPVDADGSTWASSAAPPAAPAASAAPAAVAPARMTLAEALAQDGVVQKLVRAQPKLAKIIKRLNEDDRACLRNLVGQDMEISYRDSAYVGKLINEAEQVK
jgi:hypothetical protein